MTLCTSHQNPSWRMTPPAPAAWRCHPPLCSAYSSSSWSLLPRSISSSDSSRLPLFRRPLTLIMIWGSTWGIQFSAERSLGFPQTFSLKTERTENSVSQKEPGLFLFNPELAGFSTDVVAHPSTQNLSITSLTKAKPGDHINALTPSSP